VQRHTAGHAIPGVTGLQPSPKGRVIRLPDRAANRHGRQIHVAVTELQLQVHRSLLAGCRPRVIGRLDRIHPPALLILLRMPLVEYHAIPWLERQFPHNGSLGPHFDQHRLPRLARHLADVHAPTPGKTPVNQVLMPVAFKEPMAEPSREALSQLQFPFTTQPKRTSRHCRVNRVAIDGRRRRHVMSALEPTLDLETADPCGGQLRNHVPRGEVLGAQQVRRLAWADRPAVRDRLIRQATRLAANTAIGAAAPERFAGQALPAVGNADRAVNEYLQFDARRAGNPPDLVQRKLTSQDHAPDAHFAQHLDARRVGLGHLRRRVDGERRCDPLDHSDQPEVLNNHRIGPGLADPGNEVGRPLQLVREDQRVEGHVTAYIAVVQVPDHLGQTGQGEIGRPPPGVEVLETEVHGVSAVGHGRAHALLVAGRGEKLGLAFMQQPVGHPAGLHTVLRPGP